MDFVCKCCALFPSQHYVCLAYADRCGGYRNVELREELRDRLDEAIHVDGLWLAAKLALAEERKPYLLVRETVAGLAVLGEGAVYGVLVHPIVYRFIQFAAFSVQTDFRFKVKRAVAGNLEDDRTFTPVGCQVFEMSLDATRKIVDKSQHGFFQKCGYRGTGGVLFPVSPPICLFVAASMDVTRNSTMLRGP